MQQCLSLSSGVDDRFWNKKRLSSSIIQIMTKQQPCGFIVYLNFQALELSVSRGSSLSYNIVGMCNKAANTVIRPRAKHWEGVLFRIYNRRFSQRSLHNNTSSTWQGYELIYLSHSLSVSVYPLFIFVSLLFCLDLPHFLLPVHFLVIQVLQRGLVHIGHHMFCVLSSHKHTFISLKPFRPQC